MGRASPRIKLRGAAMRVLEPAGTKVAHRHAWLGIIGNYLLMMFYTTVAGWMLYYVVAHGRAARSQGASAEVGGRHVSTTCWREPGAAGGLDDGGRGAGLRRVQRWALQKGVERITKAMMVLPACC